MPVKAKNDHQAEDCNEYAVNESKNTKNSEKMCQDFSLPGKQVPAYVRVRK